jgi:hypothetical protein
MNTPLLSLSVSAPTPGSVDEMAELRKHAAEQAALFNLGAEEADTAEESSGDHVGE